ncbi:RHS repeat-associated core domain-containing protein [Streptomyces sp. MRC013]|nr:RHS repeat-associated core domain-containing protein [Streptomyces sp. MRC013]
MAVTRRYTTPFGAQRGPTAPTWPDDKSFLGKPEDKTTGLTHIGAREYDPVIARFLSVDPKLELGKHQSMNGYSYVENNPLVRPDRLEQRLHLHPRQDVPRGVRSAGKEHVERRLGRRWRFHQRWRR